MVSLVASLRIANPVIWAVGTALIGLRTSLSLLSYITVNLAHG